MNHTIHSRDESLVQFVSSGIPGIPNWLGAPVARDFNLALPATNQDFHPGFPGIYRKNMR
jgi:hypothetical protein